MAQIPPFFLDCVVAIGVDSPDGKRQWGATGFLFGDYLKTSEDGSESYYKVFLVTNRHVFEGLQMVYLRFNPQANERAREYPLPLSDEGHGILWRGHPNSGIDVAVMPINFEFLKQEGIQASYFHSDEHVADLAKLNKLGVTEGDFVYVLGFPMGLIGGERNAVIARSGSVARIRDALAGANQEFLVDAFVFPGNSGGPVFTKPEVVAIQGTKPVGAAWLIGIVKSYVPYEDVAISRQTGQVRVVFQENSGLAAVHPVDFVLGAIGASQTSGQAAENEEKASSGGE